jgi:hypothetical protein
MSITRPTITVTPAMIAAVRVIAISPLRTRVTAARHPAVHRHIQRLYPRPLPKGTSRCADSQKGDTRYWMPTESVVAGAERRRHKRRGTDARTQEHDPDPSLGAGTAPRWCGGQVTRCLRASMPHGVGGFTGLFAPIIACVNHGDGGCDAPGSEAEYPARTGFEFT